jgi:hypothetical protein
VNIRHQFALLTAFLVLLGGLCAMTPTEPEDELKAAAVLSFLRYSTWPTLQGEGLTVGVMGRPAFAQTLAHALDGKTVSNHPVHVVELSPSSDLRSCQVVYLAIERNADVQQVLAGTSNLHALTIGEAERFLDMGGMVHLFITEGHISFETNLEAVERSGVNISSRLLRLGQVRDRAKSGHQP